MKAERGRGGRGGVGVGAPAAPAPATAPPSSLLASLAVFLAALLARLLASLASRLDDLSALLVSLPRAFRSLSWALRAGLAYRALYARADRHGLQAEARRRALSALHSAAAARLVRVCRANGGVYIKFAQFCSSLQQVPPEYRAHLAQLQDRARPRPFRTVERVLRRELGVPLERAFPEFDPEAAAAASLAQVHRARLACGAEVAVKIQYAGLAGAARADLATLDALALLAAAAFPRQARLGWLCAEMRRKLSEELDFGVEVANARRLVALQRAAAEAEWAERSGGGGGTGGGGGGGGGGALPWAAPDGGHGHGNGGASSSPPASSLPPGWAPRVVVPRFYEHMCTPKVLVMEWVHGVKVSDAEALRRHKISPRAVAERVEAAFAEMLFSLGWVHADPHPGNIIVRVLPTAGGGGGGGRGGASSASSASSSRRRTGGGGGSRRSSGGGGGGGGGGSRPASAAFGARSPQGLALRSSTSRFGSAGSLASLSGGGGGGGWPGGSEPRRRSHSRSRGGGGGLAAPLSPSPPPPSSLDGASPSSSSSSSCPPKPGLLHWLRRGSWTPFEVVLLDHGSYLRVPPTLRKEYAALWCALAAGDRVGASRVSISLGGQRAGQILPVVLTQRARTAAERERVHEAAGVGGFADVADLLQSAPRDVVEVMRITSVVRSVTAPLGFLPGARARVNGGFALRASDAAALEAMGVGTGDAAAAATASSASGSGGSGSGGSSVSGSVVVGGGGGGEAPCAAALAAATATTPLTRPPPPIEILCGPPSSGAGSSGDYPPDAAPRARAAAALASHPLLLLRPPLPVGSKGEEEGGAGGCSSPSSLSSSSSSSCSYLEDDGSTSASEDAEHALPLVVRADEDDALLRALMRGAGVDTAGGGKGGGGGGGRPSVRARAFRAKLALRLGIAQASAGARAYLERALLAALFVFAQDVELF